VQILVLIIFLKVGIVYMIQTTIPTLILLQLAKIGLMAMLMVGHMAMLLLLQSLYILV
jgi:hypothetical protein